MKLYVYFFVVMLALAGPAHALLGAKLALLGVLKNSFGGGGGYGSGYGGGYGGGYGRGYSNGGYNRPVYSGQNYNYGWGQQNYGGGYNSGGYNDGNVRVIKVIVNHEQPETYYDNYARSSIASVNSGSSSANWAPIPAPVAPTYAVQPVQSVSSSIPAPQPVQVQTAVPQLAPAAVPVQVIQPPRPVYVQSQLQPGYQQVNIQRPIQYPVQQPQPSIGQTQPSTQLLAPGQQSVNTIKLIVDGNGQHVPAASYGPPVPDPNLVAPSVDNSGAWSSDAWSSANNVGSGTWKKGGIWESIGC